MEVTRGKRRSSNNKQSPRQAYVSESASPSRPHGEPNPTKLGAIAQTGKL